MARSTLKENWYYQTYEMEHSLQLQEGGHQQDTKDFQRREELWSPLPAEDMAECRATDLVSLHSLRTTSTGSPFTYTICSYSSTIYSTFESIVPTGRDTVCRRVICWGLHHNKWETRNDERIKQGDSRAVLQPAKLTRRYQPLPDTIRTSWPSSCQFEIRGSQVQYEPVNYVST